MSMEVDFENISEIVSSSDFVIVTRTHAYSFLGLMVFYFELSMNLFFGKDCESSLLCWDSSMASILIFRMNFFTIGCSEKKYVKKNRGINIIKIVEKVAENLTRRR